jgi:hypothetical protein
MLTWLCETGLDGVVFERQAPLAPGGTAPPWLLHGWQCKGGHRTVEVTGGKLGTSVDIYTADGAVGRLDDATIHGIIVTAQVGMCQLMAAWHAAMGAHPVAARLTLLPASLLITTTKDARKAKHALAGMVPLRLQAGVVKRVGVPAACLKPYAKSSPSALTRTIDVQLHDGLGWLRTCLPADVRQLGLELCSVEADVLPLLRELPAPAARAEPRGCLIM